MKEQLKFVQILRGFAAIAVLLFHLDGFTLNYFKHSLFNFRYGFLGFDFFFVLTGFIITYVHFRETKHRSSVKKFLLKRFVRVYPFYWLIFLIVVGLESPEFVEKPTLRSVIDPTTADGWSNIIKNLALYPIPDSFMPVGIVWGLSHAIVFYLLFALSIMLGWAIGRIILSVWLLLIVLNAFHIFPGSLLLEAVAGARNIQILTGCFAGYLFVKNKLELKMPALISLVLAAIILMSVYIFWRGFDSNDLVIDTLLGVTFSAILFYAASLDRVKLSGKISRKYASPYLVLTGDAAYSIFLTHIIFIPYLCIALNKVLNITVIPVFFKNILIIIVFFLTVIAGILSYLLIERPLLNFLRQQFRLKRQKKNWI